MDRKKVNVAQLADDGCRDTERTPLKDVEFQGTIPKTIAMRSLQH